MPSRRQFLATATGLGATAGLAGGPPTRPAAGHSGHDGADGVGAPESRILLDLDLEHLGTTAVNGRPYEAYRYENLVPGASGIDIYGEAGRVGPDEGNLADRVVYDVVWREVIESLLPRQDEIRETFDTAIQRSQEIRTVLTGPRSVLNDLDGRIQQMKSVSIDQLDISLWDVATSVYPSLGSLAAAIQTAATLVDDLVTNAGDVETHLPALRDLLVSVDDPAEADPSTVEQHAGPGGDAVRNLEENADALLAEVERIESDARSMLDQADDVAAELIAGIENQTGQEIPGFLVGTVESIIDGFVQGIDYILDRAIAEVVDPLLDPVEAFSETMGEVRETLQVAADARERQEEYYEAWEERHDASERVDVAVAGGGLGALALLVSTWSIPLEEEH